MNKIGIVFTSLALLYSMPLLAASDDYEAKSSKDNCKIIADKMTITDENGDEISGMMIKAQAPDGSRLDIHCSRVIVKMKNDERVFVANLSEDDLQECVMHEHNVNAGMDDEKFLEETQAFVEIKKQDNNEEAKKETSMDANKVDNKDNSDDDDDADDD